MTNSSNVISEFRHDFDFPDKDFLKSIRKSLKVELIHEHKDRTFREGITSRYVFELYNFKVIIPNGLYDFLKDNHPDYDKIDEDSHFKTKKFTRIIRTKSFEELQTCFQKMTQDALFMKKLEEYDKFRKVIFIGNYFRNKIKWGKYNHAYMGNDIDLGYNYFVAFEIPYDDAFKGMMNRYYGLKRMPRQHMSNPKNELPFIPDGELQFYTKIKWTQEREDFLKLVEDRVEEISKSINDFVLKLNDTDFELTMKNIKLLKLDGGDKK